MTAKGHTIQGEEKEWKDEQVLFIRDYESLVAIQDPNIATKELQIPCSVQQGYDKEKERFVLLKNNENN